MGTQKASTPPRNAAQRASRTPAPPERESVVCGAPDCDVAFVPQRSTATYHSATCRQRASRARKAAERAAEVDAKADEGSAEHELVKATRRELEEFGKLDTVDGQLALQLARRLVDPEISGFDRLAQTLRSVMAALKGADVPPGEPTPPSAAEEDEVARARRVREEAREAAGRS